MFIPNVLYDILTAHRDKTVGEIKATYQHSHDAHIDAYFSEILDRGYGQACERSEVDCFPELDSAWERPELITNAILDLDPSSPYDLVKTARELETVGCKAVQIRVFSEISPAELVLVLTSFEHTRVEHIELLIRYSTALEDNTLVDICRPFPRVNGVTLHASPENGTRDFNQEGITITHISDEIRSASHCGVINPAFFNVTLDNFLESHQFNSCLHKKISVDVHGMVRNCPSMDKSYGHISDTSFLEVLSMEGFKTLWGVTKDQVNICRHCEFRYICTDCRVFTETADVPYNKPSRCGYDPFTAKWETGTPFEA
jgi:SPASM domain peptide maturase of grasp-with-spasm system